MLDQEHLNVADVRLHKVLPTLPNLKKNDLCKLKIQTIALLLGNYLNDVLPRHYHWRQA